MKIPHRILTVNHNTLRDAQKWQKLHFGLLIPGLSHGLFVKTPHGILPVNSKPENPGTPNFIYAQIEKPA